MDIITVFRDASIASVSLLVVYRLGIRLFDYLMSKQKSESSQIRQLCDRLDDVIKTNQDLIRLITKSLIVFEKDQKEIINMLNGQNSISNDIQTRVVKVDERTKRCLGGD